MSAMHKYCYVIFIMALFPAIHVSAKIGIQHSWFAEVYDETINIDRDGDNTVTSAHFIEGIKFQFPNFIKTLEVYLKQRYGSDANRDYWNNRGEIMLGTRVRFFRKIYVALFYEYIRGWYMGEANSQNPNPYGESYEDMRYGLIFWQGMDMENKKKWKENSHIFYP